LFSFILLKSYSHSHRAQKTEVCVNAVIINTAPNTSADVLILRVTVGHLSHIWQHHVSQTLSWWSHT